MTVRLRLARFGFGAIGEAYKGSVLGEVIEIELRVHVAWFVVVVRRGIGNRWGASMKWERLRRGRCTRCRCMDVWVDAIDRCWSCFRKMERDRKEADR